MFKNCTVRLNGLVIADSNGWYAHQAAVPSLLTHGGDEKGSIMTSILYYKDTTPELFDPTKNLGFKSRQDLASGSKIIDMVGRIPMSIFQQPKYLPTSCAVSVSFTRQAPEFCLDCATTTKSYIYEIVNAELHVRMLTMNPEIVSAHNKEFSKEKAKYPLRETSIRKMEISSGTQTYTSDTIVNGKLPGSVLLGIITQEAYCGRLNKSPLNFQDFNLTSVTLSCNNDPKTTRTIQVDFENKNYLMGYQSLFKALGRRGHGNNISREDYINGNVLFLFDLQSSFGREFHLGMTGQIRVSRFYVSNTRRS